MILDLALAFLAGLLSFASTCVLPLVPAYIAYMGAAAAGTVSTTRQQLTVLGNAALFVGGFATAFVALGASFGLIGADLRAYRPQLLQIAGVALVLIGIALLVWGRIPGLMSEKRLDIAHRLPRTPWAAYVIGLAFAIGWTPCVGPILAAILLRAGSTGTAAQGALLLAVYSAGLGLPFLIAAGLSGALTRLLARVRGAYGVLNAVAAVFLIGMGVLIFSNRLTVFNDFFPVVAVTTPFDSHFETDNPTPAPHGSVQVGKPAPAFTLKDVNGQTVSLTSVRGHPVLVSFWATWCVPCRDELPLIRDEYLAHRSEGLSVVAIDFGNESSETVRSFWRSMNLQPAPVLDPEGKAADAYGVALNSSGLPVSVLIARDGTVSSYEPFPLTSDYLDPALAKILS
ncbi:MAG TPA: cytochrome c biogenesis protein/redoxin [Candidatus Dormibacteraeota bacterium]|nr:cytochrome c biogenesis protein/redoxin [Candidatus Dormibacteraeota bacterium]